MKILHVILVVIMTFTIKLNAQADDILSILKNNYENGTAESILPIPEDTIALNVNSAEFWYLKAMCEDQVGDLIASRNSLIKSNVNGYYKKGDLYFYLAKVELKLGNEEASLNYIKEALDENATPIRFEIAEFDQLKTNVDFFKLLDSYKPSLNGWSIVFLFIGFQGILLFSVLFYRKRGNTKANKNIGLFVLCFAFILILFVLYKSGYNKEFPFKYLRKLWVPLIFLLGPLLLFYVNDLFKIKYSKRHKLLHLSLSFIAFFYYATYHLINPENSSFHMSMDVIYSKWLRNSQLFIYLLLVYNIIKKKKDSLGNNVVKWLHYMVYAYACFVATVCLYAALGSFEFFSRDGWDYITCLFISLSIILLGLFGIIQPQIFWGFNIEGAAYNVVKYEKSALTPGLSAELKQKLVALMIDEKAYKINNLNLERLSDMLGTTKHNTSQIINEEFNENFFDFLNDFRIEEAKELLLIKGSEMTISEILYEVGFNNKVTFNKAFKKRLSITPTQFKVQISQAI